MAITISGEERDLIYSRLRIDLHAIEDLMPTVERGEYEEADRLASAVADALRLIVEDLRWGPGTGGGIEVSSPPELLLRVLGRLEEESAGQPGGDVKALKLQLLCITMRSAIEQEGDAAATEGSG